MPLILSRLRRAAFLTTAGAALSCASASTETPPQNTGRLVFLVQPGAATAGSAFSLPIQVAIQDNAGTTLTNATNSVTLAISAGSGASGALLSGTLTRAAVGGVATFNNIAVDKAGTGYTLAATSTGLSSVTSSAFNVTTAGGGGTLLFQEDFEDANLAARGWYDNTNVVLSATEKISGSNSSAQYRFLLGATGPTSGGSQRHKFTATTTLYISFYVKYSANWVGSGKLYHPHEFYVLSDLDGDFDGPSSNWMTLYVEHNYQNGGRPRLAMQDNKAINTSSGPLPNNLVGVTENRSTGGCNGIAELNMPSECFQTGATWYNDKQLTGPVKFQPSPGPGYKNDWNFVEAYFQLNTIANGIGQADGVMQYWFNGELVIDRSDILFRTGARANLRFRQFLTGFYIGDGSPVDQSVFIDNLKVATARLP